MRKSKISQKFSELGKKGGKALVEKYGSDYMRTIAIRGLKKRYKTNKFKNEKNKEN